MGELLKNPDVSIVVVSFNTKALLRECLQSIADESEGLVVQTIVVDNDSKDGSPQLVKEEFPEVELIETGVNLGFAGANNVGFKQCRGRYVVLLNSDAFLQPGSLRLSVKKMDEDPAIGLGGARLVGRDGSWQPSARMFPSVLNDFLTLSGLAAKYSQSKFFGRVDRTWASPDEEADVDWVPGAFSIVPRGLLEKIQYFDEDFFLYYEEVDLCRRIKKLGYRVCYWPDVVVVHVGGESTRSTGKKVSKSGNQVALWRMRSELLYYRKHHGALGAFLAKQLDQKWHAMRALRNSMKGDEDSQWKADEFRELAELMERAWSDTKGGKISPPRPW